LKLPHHKPSGKTRNQMVVRGPEGCATTVGVKRVEAKI